MTISFDKEFDECLVSVEVLVEGDLNVEVLDWGITGLQTSPPYTYKSYWLRYHKTSNFSSPHNIQIHLLKYLIEVSQDFKLLPT